jgi:hypothetical protein
MSIESRIRTSTETLLWVQANLNGLRIERLSEEKRLQLAGACWHVAAEHSQAIVVLLNEGLNASALAMIRPMIEAFVRGLWLQSGASDAQVDAAERDQFPNDFFGEIMGGIERSGGLTVGAFATPQTRDWWRRLCSLTHTGYQQIAPRLTTEGLGYNYPDQMLIDALDLADTVALATVVSFATVTRNHAIAQAAIQRWQSVRF